MPKTNLVALPASFILPRTIMILQSKQSVKETWQKVRNKKSGGRIMLTAA
jgi:hypothetical protein